jgi:hypothetical protein
LEYFGKQLTFLGMLPTREFEEWARTAMFTRASRICLAIEAALKRDSCDPEYWADDLSKIIDQISLAVTHNEYAVPEELRGSGGLHTAQEITRQFGDALCWWPAIIERTRKLAESGVRIGIALD